MNIQNYIRKLNNMKFTAETEYNWIFKSEAFTVRMVGSSREMLVRWTFDNMYGFSAYDKATCAYTGERCNFDSIALEYQTELQGKMVWIALIDYEPAVTKKQTMATINQAMEGFKTGKDGLKIKKEVK